MQKEADRINNAFYDTLDEGWFTAQDHPIALLRAENAIRNPWIAETIMKLKGSSQTVLDIGCGAGLLSNDCAKEGHLVTGIDLSPSSLALAEKESKNSKTRFIKANAEALPFEDASFDVVCAMDLLEHVESPGLVIKEAARVLKPGGLFFFHTFNRNFLSYIIIIKGVDWFVKNAPKNMHVYPLFIKPKELKAFCKAENLEVENIRGLIPDASRGAFWKMLVTGKISKDFRFTFSKSSLTGYVGFARKTELS